ncbi:MAG: AAA family ATPase [Gammaproteobacteria bacterium]|nr:AAA family ATPase [Gammaproteobacteria bacterium]MDP2139468.1 AAA family ATPase [Gammaproteobacteria bacterium]MDP2346304.1 AAA family ATPase [Gammaproteobacteria bacterium]
MFKELILALNKPDGFVKVTGQAGVGKTTLRRKVLRALHIHSNRYIVIDIPYPRMNETGFFSAIAHELQITETPGPYLKGNVMTKLISLVESGKRIALIIDEGQSIPETTLDTLLELSRQKHGEKMLVRTIIFAQIEFDEMLNKHRQKMLKERVTASHVLSPISHADIPQYVALRLGLSGYNGDQLFSSKALQLLGNASRGIPRLINLLAHKAMMVAYAEGATTVDTLHIKRAVADTAAAEQPVSKSKPGWLGRIRG